MTAAAHSETQKRTRRDTIVLERTYNASPARVFAAWESVEARLRWSVPYETAGAVYDQAEFRVGGLDIMRCGQRDDMRYKAHVRYLEIRRDARIVMAESLAEDGIICAASLISVELEPVGKATRQTVTLHVSAFDGTGMIEGYNDGWSAALDNLAAEF